MRPFHAIAALALSLAAPALAEDAKGDWTGSLKVAPTASLRLAVHIAADDGGALTGTLDSLDQGATGIPLADIQATEETLTFKVPAVNGSYVARWDAERKVWDGSWTQGGAALPVALSRGGPAAPPPSPAPVLPADWQIPDDAAIGRLIADRIAGRDGQGIVVGLLSGDDRRTAAGGPKGAATFDAGTIFEIGSMTKVFTGLLLADMVVKGEVKLDDPVAGYLPEGATMPERGGRAITLRDLATHRSGLPRLPSNLAPADPLNPYADYDEAQLLAFLKDYALPREIGSEFEYSNLGFGLLGYALARAAGTDYASLVRDRITGPLGMKDTVVALSSGQAARFATPHDQYVQPTSPWDLPVLAGAGALRSTAADMLLFLDAATGRANGPLKAAAKLATARHADGPGPRTSMGLGWMRAETPAGLILTHDGGTGGFRTSMVYDPAKDRGVIALTNAAVEPAVNDLAQHLLVGAPVMATTPVPAAPPRMAPRQAVALSEAELDRVTGTYAFEPSLTITVSRDGGRLFIEQPGTPRVPLPASAPLTFFLVNANAEFVFEPDASGKVTGVTLNQNGQTLKGRRVE